MSVPVAFGQYVRVDSPIHRLDARTKIGVTFAFTLALFAVQSWLGLALVAALGLTGCREDKGSIVLVGQDAGQPAAFDGHTRTGFEDLEELTGFMGGAGRAKAKFVITEYADEARSADETSTCEER